MGDKVSFVCTECGADYVKWVGQCSACGEWSSLKEFKQPKVADSRSVGLSKRNGYAGAKSSLQKLGKVETQSFPRIKTGLAEFDRVLGDGIVPGSAILIGGAPGAGKSTLLLQTACHLSSSKNVLYVTGEESIQQVAQRAKRLGLNGDELDILSETSVNIILDECERVKPEIVIIDSIQVMHLEGVTSAPGSVSQVKESAASLTQYAKQTNTAFIIVGHVTKDNALAGPKVLEHIIDAACLLDSASDSRYRTLRATKNRFGAVNELGVFAMGDTGLKEVKNPSAIFLNRINKNATGSTVTVTWEGTRPLLVEIQALCDECTGNPRRMAVGTEMHRLIMSLAVMHRHAQINCGIQDVFVNVVGGVKINETCADLPSLISIVSSLRDKPIPSDWVIFGEVGLSGEIRPVPNGQERIREAAKHGFKKAIVPSSNKPKTPIPGIQVEGFSSLREVIEYV